MCIYVCRLDFTYITLLILLQTPIFYYSHTSQEITKATDVKAMAFERPVEADRVDDLGLLSSIVRGPIMWMLGGDRDKQADKPADATLMLPPRPPMRAIREAAEEGEGTVSPGTVEGAPSPAMNKGGKSPMPAAVLCDAGSSEEEEEGDRATTIPMPMLPPRWTGLTRSRSPTFPLETPCPDRPESLAPNPPADPLKQRLHSGGEGERAGATNLGALWWNIHIFTTTIR